jgi:hypothetical protein
MICKSVPVIGPESIGPLSIGVEILGKNKRGKTDKLCKTKGFLLKTRIKPKVFTCI